MGLILYFKKQFTLFRFFFKRNSIQLRTNNFLKFIKRTPFVMKLYFLTYFLFYRLFLFTPISILKYIWLNFPLLLFILGLIFRIVHLTLEILLCNFAPLEPFLIIFYHFFSFFEFLLTIRILIEWFPAINPNKNVIGECVYALTDFYFKIFDNLSSGGKASLLAYIIIDYILDALSFFIISKFRISLDSRGFNYYSYIQSIKYLFTTNWKILIVFKNFSICCK